tara:strand:- start:339 stop:1334 length:996 start_codon:yes stop_codon:yes gene_type:complete
MSISNKSSENNLIVSIPNKPSENNFESFKNLNVTTTTQIAIVLDTVFDLEKIYSQISEFSPDDYGIIINTKQKVASDFFQNKIPKGTIIHAKYKDKQKGCQIKKKKKTTTYGKRNFFLNAICMVVHTHKIINFKITNSKFQITGCQDTNSALELVQIMISKFIKYPIPCVTFKTSPQHEKFPEIEIIFNTVMTNVDFNLHFLVDRMNLDKLYSDSSEFISILENSFGHAGVNIKYFSKQFMNKTLTKMTSDKDSNWYISDIKYSDFIANLPQKEKEYEEKKKQIHTLLIFHSGKGIISGPCIKEMSVVYDKFIDNLARNKVGYSIEEKLDV